MGTYKELRKEQIIDHLRGNLEDATDVIGVFPLLTDDTCRFIVFDFDNHEWIILQKPIEASLARKFGNALLNKGAESVNLKFFRFYDRMLPMQAHLPEGGVGNLIALPLQGQALKEGNSAFVDEHWNAYPDQWEVLLNKKKLSKEFIEDKIKEWAEGSFDIAAGCEDIFDNDNEKPWEKTKHFQKEDVKGILQITLSDGVYVNTVNLQSRIQNRIRRMAAFSNPVFYKNQAMGLSNFEYYRYIYLGSGEDGFIKVPRGILENITEACEKAGIEYEIEDKRSKGHPIHVEFIGELKESQIPAVERLLQNDNGIMNAATAFGKTVVCCNVIAKRQVVKRNEKVSLGNCRGDTILLQESLILQWSVRSARMVNITGD